MADHAVGKTHNTIGNTTVEHQLTGEHKKRDRQEREHLHAAHCFLEDDGDRNARVHNRGNRSQANGESHWYAQNEQYREADGENCEFHVVLSGIQYQAGTTSSWRSNAMMCSMLNITISTPAMTSDR